MKYQIDDEYRKRLRENDKRNLYFLKKYFFKHNPELTKLEFSAPNPFPKHKLLLANNDHSTHCNQYYKIQKITSYAKKEFCSVERYLQAFEKKERAAEQSINKIEEKSNSSL